MPKCTINGQEVEVKPGANIIEGFMQLSEEIAHYCWHPGLSVAGVCRMCMVEIEGNPRVQIACNTPVVEGMKINNNSPKVKEAVEWTLKFHLINHPLDCPICDQAGECGLQEYYMSHGEYDSQMAERKVKKRKVVSLGERVVLDTERCILCSRCVRFTDEVTKTNELGIFNRGDRSEIGTFEDRPLNNNYSLNTVDICPVGALTSKDFRFRQRAWFLKSFDSVCNGCSTGCNVKIYYNENGLYRVKPNYNPEVNGHWMCDEGRDTYKFANEDQRLKTGVEYLADGSVSMPGGKAAQRLGEILKSRSAQEVAVVMTGQFTNEENDKLIETLKNKFNINQIAHYINNEKTFDDFDGILLKGDRNPNTLGLLKSFEKAGIKFSWKDLESGLKSKSIKTVVFVGPENLKVYPDLQKVIDELSSAELVVLSSVRSKIYGKAKLQVPLKSFVEKSGTFVNAKGMAQKINKGPVIVSQALTLIELSVLMSGEPLQVEHSQYRSATAGGY